MVFMRRKVRGPSHLPPFLVDPKSLQVEIKPMTVARAVTLHQCQPLTQPILFPGTKPPPSPSRPRSLFSFPRPLHSYIPFFPVFAPESRRCSPNYRLAYESNTIPDFFQPNWQFHFLDRSPMTGNIAGLRGRTSQCRARLSGFAPSNARHGLNNH